jgi:hypothetical protein
LFLLSREFLPRSFFLVYTVTEDKERENRDKFLEGGVFVRITESYKGRISMAGVEAVLLLKSVCVNPVVAYDRPRSHGFVAPTQAGDALQRALRKLIFSKLLHGC